MAEDQNHDQNTEESGNEEDQTFTKEQAEKLAADAVAKATESLKKEYGGIQSGLQKTVNEKDAELKKLREAQMSDEEKWKAEMEETRRLINEEKSLRIKAENKSVAQTLLNEAGLKVSQKLLDRLVADDVEQTKEFVSAYIETAKELTAEANKAHDRANGRRIETVHKDGGKVSYDQLREMSDDEIKQFSPEEIAKITSGQ
jgi:hypothetical protein